VGGRQRTTLFMTSGGSKEEVSEEERKTKSIKGKKK